MYAYSQTSNSFCLPKRLTAKVRPLRQAAQLASSCLDIADIVKQAANYWVYRSSQNSKNDNYNANAPVLPLGEGLEMTETQEQKI